MSLLLLSELLFSVTNAYAVSRFAIATGNWSTAGTWSNVSCASAAGGGVPAAGDDVTICPTRTVTLNLNSPAVQSVTVNNTGILRFGNNNTARSLTISGNLTIDAGGTLNVNPASNITHTLNVGGDLANAGTLQLVADANSLANTTFNGSGTQTVSGSGATTSFNRITVNMAGASIANIVDVTASSFAFDVGDVSTLDGLTLTDGTFRLSSAVTIAPFDNGPISADPDDYIIAANARFWLNSAGAVVNYSQAGAPAGANHISVDGELRIDAGTFNLGDALDERLRLRPTGTGGTFVMNGGSLNIAGRLTSVTATDDGNFTMGGGVITLGMVGNSIATFGPFLLGSATNFTMSGGTIIIQNASTGAANEYDNRAAISTVTGGTIQFGNASTPAGQTMQINTPAPVAEMPNVLINATNDPDVTLVSNITVVGNWTNNSAGTFSGAFTTTFGGGTAQAIGGTNATTFNALTINKSANDVTINTTPTVGDGVGIDTLTFTQGRFITGANRIILQTTATIATPSATSYVVGALQKNYAAAAGLSYFAGNDFPVGDSVNYSPFNITAGTTITAGSLTVSATATDHPQVTTPIPSTMIDSAKSVNRYWTVASSGITLGTAVDATFTYINGTPVDLDAGVTPANFIVQRYDGVAWNATTLSGTPTATSASITGLTGAGDFAIGEQIVVVSTPGDFNAFETATTAGAITGRIYTKLAGANFSLDVVAILLGAQHAAFTDTVLVDLVTGSTGGLNCPGTPVAIAGTSQNVNLTSGRGTTGNFNVASADPDVRVRVRYPVALPTVTSCSTDNFSIRPTSFTVTSTNATQTGTSGTPIIKTGVNFNLTAASLPGYNGTPQISNAQVVGTPNAGTIGGVFSAAPVGTGIATGNAFFYNEVGNFGLNANAVFDSGFTAVDQPGDCTADFSNTLVGGKYGCSFGSTAIAQNTGVSGFGRFIPDNFAVSFNAPTLGTACGTFSYTGQTFTYTVAPVMTVMARSGTNNGLANTTTTNYAGAYMKLANTGASLNQAPYNTQGGRYARFDALGGGTPTLDVSQLPATTTDPVISVFIGGIGTLTFDDGAGFGLTRSIIAPHAPFDADIALGLNIVDGDAVAYATNPAMFGMATAGNGMAFSAGKPIRYGRLRLANANGSGLLNLPIGVRTQYWSGTAFVTNTADNCTILNAGNINLTSPPAGVAAVTGGTFIAGIGSLTLTKPTVPAKVTVDLCVDLSSDPGGGTVCVATAAGLPYLQGLWAPGTNYNNDPPARATFGVFKGADEFIYLRENY